MKNTLGAILVMLNLSFALMPIFALAGLDEGIAAYEKGDYATALKELKPLATKGDAFAQYKLGLMYAKGQGVPQDYKEAVKWCRLAADQGNASCQTLLGAMYVSGQEVPQDNNEAAKWFRLAADQGDADAQSFLGSAYFGGKGVLQDYKEAVKWYRLSADQGNAFAQYNLGLMYAKGQGVALSKIIAYALYNISAVNDPSDENLATKNRTSITETMTPKEIEEGQNLSKEMFQYGNFLKVLDAYVNNK